QHPDHRCRPRRSHGYHDVAYPPRCDHQYRWCRRLCAGQSDAGSPRHQQRRQTFHTGAVGNHRRPPRSRILCKLVDNAHAGHRCGNYFGNHTVFTTEGELILPTESKRSDSKKPRGDKVAKRAQKVLGNAVDAKGRPTPTFQRAVLTAMRWQRPLVVSQLRRLTKKYPYDSPEELAQRIAKTYIGSLTTTGAAAGGVGAVPGIGTAASLGASFGAAIGFLELTSLYAQAVAELAGLHTKNDHESQTLVMTIMLGEDGRALLQQAASAQPGARFGTLGPAAWIASGITGLTERAFNALSRRFMADLVRGETVRFLGRMVPFGIGAGIG